MKLTAIKYLALMPLVIGQAGCAVYTAASTASYIATDKTLTDHAASTITQSDCNAVRTVTNQTYYCELAREPGTTYNRHRF